MKITKKFPGSTLIEVLVALCVLGIVVPPALGALGGVLAAELKFHENARMISSAEWWFSRLTFPVYGHDIDAAPREDKYGKTRFEWDTENLENGAIRVTLRVHGRFSVLPFTVSRIF
ncbi:MAG: hypothetical protein FWG71_05090 [Synergistaceae bacterium]|nr:hypothetical protein [Synergistaceae bacterium]